MILKLRGRVTEDGKLEVELPEGFPAGEVDVEINANRPNPKFDPIVEDQDNTPLTEEEIAELLSVEPVSGAELVRMIESGEIDTSAWHDITDSTAWLEEVRRKRNERHQW